MKINNKVLKNSRKDTLIFKILNYNFVVTVFMHIFKKKKNKKQVYHNVLLSSLL